MKRKFALLLTLVMVLSVFSPKAFAQNGPNLWSVSELVALEALGFPLDGIMAGLRAPLTNENVSMVTSLLYATINLIALQKRSEHF